jgi:predicted permease
MFSSLVARLRGLARRNRIDTEVDQELRFHLEMEIQANVARGMTPSGARRVALRDLGGVTQTKEAVRGVRSTIFDSIWQDIRYAARLLARSPGFTTAAVVTLALGIGANAAIFSLIDSVLLHPLPVVEPDRLVSFSQRDAGAPFPSDGFLYTELQAFREHLRSFEGLAGEGARIVGLGDEEGTRKASVLFVSSNYFQVVGVRPRLGRWFLPEEERQGAAPVAVLAYSAWQRWFGGDSKVIGSSLRLTGVPATIVGVAPRGFRGTVLARPVDVFVPVMAAATVAALKENFFSDQTVDSGDGLFSPSSWLRVVGRLKPGISRETADAELRVFASGSSLPSMKQGTLSLVPAVRSCLREPLRTSNVNFACLLAGIVALVLLVGCTGLAGLLLAQIEKRRRELAARLALGAPRRRLLRQLLTETGLLVLIGSLCGLVVSRLMLAALSSFDLPGRLSIEDLDPRLNGSVLAFAIGAALITGILSGVVPAWRASFACDLASSLKAVGRTTGRGRSRLQPAMLGLHFALTVVLLVGAGLFVRSVQAGFATDFGFRPERLVSVDLNPQLRRYDQQRATALIDQLAERLRHLPRVEAVTIGSTPLSMPAFSGPSLGADGQRKRIQPLVAFCFVDRDYFRTLGIRLERGRDFTRDDGRGGAPVTVINTALARELWPNDDAIGRRVTNLPVRSPDIVPQAEVIGIVANAKVGLLDKGTPVLYLLRDQNPIFNRGATTVTIRAARDPQEFVPLLRQQVRAVDRDLPVTGIVTMEEQIGKALAAQRMGAWLTGWFSLLALSLALVGSYGIVAYAVARRTSEIGLRVALGASPSTIPFVMLRVGLLPVLAGTLIGVAFAWPAARLIKSFLFGVPPQDPLAFAGATLLLVTAGGIASYLAARRASRVDPIEALRAE